MAVCTHVILLKTKSFAVCRVGSWICMLRNFICLTKINYRTWTFFFQSFQHLWEKFLGIFLFFCIFLFINHKFQCNFPFLPCLSFSFSFPSFLPSFFEWKGWGLTEDAEYEVSSHVVFLNFKCNYFDFSHVNFPCENESFSSHQWEA